MELRTIQRTGGSSYTMTLPKKWVQASELDNTETLACYFQTGSLMCIRPHRPAKHLIATLEIDNMSNEHIVREIIAYFVAGINEIQIHSSSIESAQRILIRNISHKLIGFEITGSTSEKIVLRNVSTTKIKVSEYIDQMLNTIDSMYSDLVTAINTGDKNIAHDIVERDVEVDRINLAIDRQFHLLLYTLIPPNDTDLNLMDLHYYNSVGIRLERMADHIVRVAHTLTQLKSPKKILLNKFEQSTVNKINDYLKLTRTIIQTNDTTAAHELLDIYTSKHKNEFINTTIVDKPSINILIQDSLERIRGYAANIAEEAINQSCIKKVLL